MSETKSLFPFLSRVEQERLRDLWVTLPNYVRIVYGFTAADMFRGSLQLSNEPFVRSGKRG